ncbi:MAG: hydroxyacylglutathione hydrolase [Alphaproteobacteria bacterium]|nr:hydroxyacylglutathione hydrolase [Alphaproteobacteria bacterium]
MGFSIDILPALADNYIYMVSDSDLGLAMAVDPGDADVVRRFLQKKDLHLALILNTHHHSDHINGNEKLQKEYGSPIVGPDKEKHHINGMTRGLSQGDVVTFSDLRGEVIETPGHTSGHISFYFPSLKALFCGDTLFSLGCGRMFEGNAVQLWDSLMTIRKLPDDTLVYCGHEYTEKNSKFAMLLDKDNSELKLRVAEVNDLRRKGLPTLPVKLGMEKKTNPFLRVDCQDFQNTLNKNGFPVQGTDPAAIFGALRAAKDRFNPG